MGEGENWALTCEDEMEIKAFLKKKKKNGCGYSCHLLRNAAHGRLRLYILPLDTWGAPRELLQKYFFRTKRAECLV